MYFKKYIIFDILTYVFKFGNYLLILKLCFLKFKVPNYLL